MAMQISCWHAPPQRLSIESAELHLWRFALKVSSPTLLQLKNTLSPDERSRAERLLAPQKAADFSVARGRLRQILGNYLNLPPAELTFSYGIKGKPALNPDLSSDLSFNLSHSGDWGLLAVAAGSAVGVDLEQIDPLIDCRKIAAQFFNPQEIYSFNNYPERRKLRGFYRLWTSKEARLKRFGFGFSADPATDKACQEERTAAFPLGKNYLAAISTSTEIYSLQRYQIVGG